MFVVSDHEKRGRLSGKSPMPINSVITNVGAMVALQSLNKTADQLSATQKRISTGYRVADAKDDGAAFAVAERIRKTIAGTPLDTQGKQVTTTVSVGVSTYPEHGEDLAVIMNRADQALYHSKKTGRNRTTVSGDTSSSA